MENPAQQSLLTLAYWSIRRRKFEFVASTILVPALLLGMFWWPLKANGLGTSADFIEFYGTGLIIRQGNSSHIYEYRYQKSAQGLFTPNAVPLVFNHPPFEAIPFAILCRLTYPVAFLVWTFINLSIIGLICFALRSYGGDLDLPARLMLLGCGLYPALATILQGQDSFFLLLGYAFAFLCLKGQSDFLAGIAISIALIKPQLVMPFVFVLLLKQKYRFVMGFLTGAALLAISSLWLISLTGVLSYLQMVLLMGGISGGEAFHMYPGCMPNLRGILWILSTVNTPRIVIGVLTLLFSATLFVHTMRRTDHLSNPEQTDFDRDFSSIVIMTLLISYHLLLHDFSLFILPAFLLLLQAGSGSLKLINIGMMGIFLTESLLSIAGYRWYSLLVPWILVVILNIPCGCVLVPVHLDSKSLRS